MSFISKAEMGKLFWDCEGKVFNKLQLVGTKFGFNLTKVLVFSGIFIPAIVWLKLLLKKLLNAK